eukprot:COSAG01_NODE_3087_length_6609_cov_2.598925_1_plen_198_part_00
MDARFFEQELFGATHIAQQAAKLKYAAMAGRREECITDEHLRWVGLKQQQQQQQQQLPSSPPPPASPSPAREPRLSAGRGATPRASPSISSVVADRAHTSLLANLNALRFKRALVHRISSKSGRGRGLRSAVGADGTVEPGALETALQLYQLEQRVERLATENAVALSTMQAQLQLLLRANGIASPEPAPPPAGEAA